MKTLKRIVILLMLLSAVVGGAFAASPAGDWAGGSNVLGGWRMIQLRLEVGEAGGDWTGSLDMPSADVMRLPLADIQVEEEQVRFRVPSPYGVYAYEGHLAGDRLSGDLTSPTGSRSSLHAVRSRTDLADRRSDLAGIYRMPGGRRLLVTPRPFGQLTASIIEEARGGLRIERALFLVPIAADRFVTSGSLVKAPKADEEIDFVRDGAGRARAAIWRAPGEKTIEAGRMEDDVTQEPVRVQSGPVQLDGTLWLPRGKGPFPAMALAHGSGPVTRDNFLMRARGLARHGFAVLAYDKRGTGRGDTRWQQASFDDLAADALAAVEFLGKHPRIDPARVGLQGNSQAGWIIPIAASRSQTVAFAIIVSGGGVTPDAQEIYRARAQTLGRGLPPAEAEAAAAFMERKRDFAFTGTGWEAYAAAVQEATAKPWFEFVNGPMVPDEIFWSDWRSYRGYDPRAFIAKLRQPVLVLLGADDDTHPAGEASRIWEETLRAAGHPDFTVRVLPGMGHNIFSRETKAGIELREDVFRLVSDWVAAHRHSPAAPGRAAR